MTSFDDSFSPEMLMAMMNDHQVDRAETSETSCPSLESSSSLSLSSVSSARIFVDFFHSQELDAVVKSIGKREWSVVEAIITKNTQLTKETIFFKHFSQRTEGLLLHALLTHRDVPAKLIKMVVDANPDALAEQDQKHKNLPIHIALYRNLPLDVINVLLLAQPSSAFHVKDKEGNTPAHVAVFMTPPKVAMKVLVDAAPSSVVSSPNVKKQLPIHMACSRSDASMDVIHHLLRMYPQGAKKTNVHKALPLHVACRCKANVDVIKLVVGTYPEAIFEFDKKNHTPYDLAKMMTCSNTSFESNETVRFLREILKHTGNKLSRTREQIKFAVEDHLRKTSRKRAAVRLELHH